MIGNLMTTRGVITVALKGAGSRFIVQVTCLGIRASTPTVIINNLQLPSLIGGFSPSIFM